MILHMEIKVVIVKLGLIFPHITFFLIIQARFIVA